MKHSFSFKKHTLLVNLMGLFLPFVLFFCLLAPPFLLPVQGKGRVVTVGYTSEADSYMRGGSDSEPKSGYAYDYLQKLSDYTGWSYRYVYGDWLMLMDQLQTGKIDLLFDVSYTEERASQMLFPKNPAGKESNYLFSRSDDESIDPTDEQTLNQKKVGVYGTGVQYTQFLSWMKKHHVHCIPVLYEHSSDRNSDLENGTLDAIVATDSHTQKTWRPISLIGTTNYYFAVSNTRTDLLDQLNDAQSKLLSTSPYYNEELQRKYFSNNIILQSLSQEEKDWLTTHPLIKVGYLANYAPYCDTDSKTQLPTGIAFDVLKQVENLYHVHFSITAFDSYQDLQKAFRQKRIQVMLPISGNKWCAEQADYRISSPIASAEMTVLSTSTDAKHLYDKIAVTKASPFQLPYVSSNYPSASLLYCDSLLDCISAVLSGKATCTMVDHSYFQMYLKNNPQLHKLSLCASYEESFVSLGVPDNDLELLSILNKGITSLGSTGLEASFIQHSLSQTPVTFLGMLKEDPLAAHLLIVIFALLFISILFLSLNRKHLIEARKAADLASQSKSQFLSRMSHEIRTPMNAITGLTTIAQHHMDQPLQLRACLDKIQGSSQVLLNIINDVLDMSAIENGKLKIAHSSFDLKKLLEDLASVYYSQCQDKGLTFEMKEDISSSFFLGDSLRLNQVLLNLVSNAYKFTEPGGHIQIYVSETARNNSLVTLTFIISDNGCGMSQDMLLRLFSPFEQENASTAKRYGGSGLGLSITKNLVELMGGTIQVSSTLGQGTQFTVTLPFQEASETDAASSPETTPPSVYQDFSGYRVLVAEDNEINREVAEGLLDYVHLKADFAVNGKEALEIFRNHVPGTYFAILMDIQMPIMDGYQTAKEIRNLTRQDASIIPIYAMTADAFLEDVQAASRAGMNGHISKPINPSELYRLLSDALSHFAFTKTGSEKFE